MNVLDRLKDKANRHGEELTVIERLILAHPNALMQLEAAAEWHEVKHGKTFKDRKDISEISYTDIQEHK